MTGNEGISVADALALRGSGTNNGFSDMGWGGNGAWWIIILILLFGGYGFGRNGFGNNSNEGYSPCCAPATAQGINDAFNFNQLDNGIRGLERGLCDGFYTAAQQNNTVLSALQNCCCETQTAMLAGFNGVNQNLCNLGYQTQAGINAISNQLSSCCCDIERGQDKIGTQLGAMTSQLLIANDKNTDRIINYLTQNEMDKLRTDLQSAQFQLSQLSQTDRIVNRILPTPQPAYLTCSPWTSAFGYGNFQNAFGSCCA